MQNSFYPHLLEITCQLT